MTEILCGGCKKPITNKTEVEYSQEFTEFYCNFDCATEALFERARCTPFDLKDKDELKEKEVVLKRGKLHWENRLF